MVVFLFSVAYQYKKIKKTRFYVVLGWWGGWGRGKQVNEAFS